MASLTHRSSFRPKPGIVDTASCKACGSLMLVKRDVNGPTGWAEAMSRRGHLHDHFWCPHYEDKWHERVEKLLEEFDKTVSKKLRAIILSEANEILTEQGKARIPD